MRDMKKMGGRKTKVMKGGQKTGVMKKNMGKKTEMRNMQGGMGTKIENFKDMMYKKFGGKT